MIRFEQVHKWYGNHHVLDGVSLHVHSGTLLVLCGESGAGKSTLLATINGLEPIQEGAIYVDGTRVDTQERSLQALRRHIGVVFQDYNLFLHMTAERNIRIGLEKSLHLSKKDSICRTHKYLERVGMLDKKDSYPAELSGGQQQRVAVARCLAMQTKILLMDEPTSALDIDNSTEVIRIIRSLKEEGITILIATHQIADFIDIADNFACIENGRISESSSRSDALTASEWNVIIADWLQRVSNHAKSGA